MLDDLGQRDFREGLPAGEAQNIGGLMLADTYAVDAGPVDFAGIGRGIEGQAHDGGRDAGQGLAEDIVGTVVEEHQLQNQGRAAHDQKIEADDAADNNILRAAADGEKKPQQHGEDKSCKEQLQRHHGILKHQLKCLV